MAAAWSELRLVGVPRSSVEDVSARLFALGAAGLQEDWMPGAAPPPLQPWDDGVPPDPDPVLLRAWFEAPARATIAASLADLDLPLAWEEVEDRDWNESWKAGIGPIAISDTLTIAPPWDAPDGALLIEVGQGFGTGQHPTTLQALRAVEALAPGLGTALDVGCGSGILALAAARHGLEVEGVDVEAPAIDEARANAERNGLCASFSTRPVHELRGARDLVLANLHAELVERLAPHLVRLCGRWLVVAGILVDREARARAALDPHLELADRVVDGEWVSLRYRRRP